MDEGKRYGIERRVHKRLAANLYLEMVVNGKTCSGEIVDLGMGGMKLQTFKRLRKRSVLHYCFLLPNLSDTYISGKGEVVWNSKGNACEHGIKFKKMRRETRELLDTFLEDSSIKRYV